MAPRIGYTLDKLREMHAGACPEDVKIVWRKDDEWNVASFEPLTGEVIPLPNFCGVREIRLFALQLLAYADERERGCRDIHEAVIP